MAEIVSDVLPVFAVVLDGVRVSRVDPEPDTVAGLKDAVTPLGRPLTAKDTEPVKPLAGVTVKVSVALMPPKQKARMQIGGVTETLAALLESANDGAAVASAYGVQGKFNIAIIGKDGNVDYQTRKILPASRVNDVIQNSYAVQSNTGR